MKLTNVCRSWQYPHTPHAGGGRLIFREVRIRGSAEAGNPVLPMRLVGPRTFGREGFLLALALQGRSISGLAGEHRGWLLHCWPKI